MSRDSDNLTYDGAQRLAENLRKYWLQRGRAVDVTIHKFSIPGYGKPDLRKSRAWVVRSNMVNGMPR